MKHLSFQIKDDQIQEVRQVMFKARVYPGHEYGLGATPETWVVVYPAGSKHRDMPVWEVHTHPGTMNPERYTFEQFKEEYT